MGYGSVSSANSGMSSQMIKKQTPASPKISSASQNVLAVGSGTASKNILAVGSGTASKNVLAVGSGTANNGVKASSANFFGNGSDSMKGLANSNQLGRFINAYKNYDNGGNSFATASVRKNIGSNDPQVMKANNVMVPTFYAIEFQAGAGLVRNNMGGESVLKNGIKSLDLKTTYGKASIVAATYRASGGLYDIQGLKNIKLANGKTVGGEMKARYGKDISTDVQTMSVVLDKIKSGELQPDVLVDFAKNKSFYQDNIDYVFSGQYEKDVNAISSGNYKDVVGIPRDNGKSANGKSSNGTAVGSGTASSNILAVGSGTASSNILAVGSGTADNSISAVGSGMGESGITFENIMAYLPNLIMNILGGGGITSASQTPAQINADASSWFYTQLMQEMSSSGTENQTGLLFQQMGSGLTA